MDGQLLTESEVADKLRISTRHLRNLSLQRSIAHVYVGKRRRYRMSDVEEWIARNVENAKGRES